MEQTLWVERYRPMTIDECVIPEKLRRTLKGFISSGELPNLMFTGTQGTGKTTLAKAIVRELGAESIFIDASTDNGKMMIQEQIVPFASTVSIMNPDAPKFVICDECDYLTPSAQASLRPIIEKYSATTRFIFTGNYPQRLIPALKSRCTHFDMSITKTDKMELVKTFFDRCKMILDENNVDFNSKVLGKFIMKHFPDFRKVINELQSYSSGGEGIDEGILTISAGSIADSLYPLIKEKDFEGCRQWLAESVNSPDDIFSSLYSSMFEHVEAQNQPELILILAQYQDSASRVSNQEINLMACFVEMMSSFSK